MQINISAEISVNDGDLPLGYYSRFVRITRQENGTPTGHSGAHFGSQSSFAENFILLPPGRDRQLKINSFKFRSPRTKHNNYAGDFANHFRISTSTELDHKRENGYQLFPICQCNFLLTGSYLN